MSSNSLFNRTAFLLPLVLVCTTVTLFPIVLNGWVNWDDPAYVLENALVQSLTWAHFKAYFNTLQVQGLYHPLTLFSLALDHAVAGDQPTWYHAHNLILHLLNTALVFVFVQQLSRHNWVAAVTALLFGIHPMHVESVAWISARKDVLYACYFLLSLIAYLVYVKKDRKARWWYILALVCFILSLLAKGMAVVLPLILILIDATSANGRWKKHLLEKLPFLALSLGFGILSVIAQQAGEAMYAITDLQWYRTIFVGGYAWLLYVIKCIVPLELAAYHPYPSTETGGLPWYVYAAMLPVLGMLFLIGRYRSNKVVFFGSLFFCVSILPVLQIVSVGKAVIAERYTYLSYIGLFYLIAWGWQHLAVAKSDNKLKLIPNIVLGAIIVCLMFWSYQRTKVWKDNLTLWSDVIQVYPNDHLAYCNRASTLYRQGSMEAALLDCNQCIYLEPSLHESYNNRGLVYMALNDMESALRDFSKALQLEPDYASARGNRAVVLMHVGQYEPALRDLETLVQLVPNDPMAFFRLAQAHQQLGHLPLAEWAINQAIELNDQVGHFYYFRGKLFEQQGWPDKAQPDLELAQRLGFRPKL